MRKIRAFVASMVPAEHREYLTGLQKSLGKQWKPHITIARSTGRISMTEQNIPSTIWRIKNLSLVSSTLTDVPPMYTVLHTVTL